MATHIDYPVQGATFVINDYEHMFDEREWKTIQNALEYAKDPFGDVGHAQKLLIAKLIGIIVKRAIPDGGSFNLG